MTPIHRQYWNFSHFVSPFLTFICFIVFIRVPNLRGLGNVCVCRDFLASTQCWELYCNWKYFFYYFYFFRGKSGAAAYSMQGREVPFGGINLTLNRPVWCHNHSQWVLACKSHKFEILISTDSLNGAESPGQGHIHLCWQCFFFIRSWKLRKLFLRSLHKVLIKHTNN